jgi:alpha-amylase/alpha-mannosidase (GH57 family)
MQERYVAVHGHFYQPPREDPWKSKIMRQASAVPYHDWNERITAECYAPNAFAKILDGTGHVQEVVSNYRHMSFNFGPTLLDWLQKQAQDVYEAIVAADKESCRDFKGHGNAIAQVYNHVIMPLANKRDRRTQIEWGLEHFAKTFAREPQAMWLAETAVSLAVLEDLVDFKMRYVVLSPFQAAKIRKIGQSDWVDVANGMIDTGVPYRIFLSKEKFVDVFFYNKKVSTGIGFGNWLKNADFLADRFEEEFATGKKFVLGCTDGESYGHHSVFGDRCLAYFIYRVARQRDLKLVNLGYYLACNPPEYEVVLQEGERQEGTSWSCSHGVGRWIRDCGCSEGEDNDWQQEWRTPLRAAFDFLRDEAAVLYERYMQRFFCDVWAARDRYVEVVLAGDSAQARRGFLKRFCKKRFVGSADKQQIFVFLEAQRFLLLMYTSCGWFFSDITRVETLQNIKYAAKAMELLRSFLAEEVVVEFLQVLSKAKSNKSVSLNGEVIFRSVQ